MKFIELIKKYKVYILAGLLTIFFFRSCGKSTEVRKLEDVVTNNMVVVDSLKGVIDEQLSTMDTFPWVLNNEKIKIHSEYDNYISEKDRGTQLMELHRVVKENIKELEDVK